MMYLIYSKKHSPLGGAAVWWGPSECGYTVNIDEAGRYSLEQAREIVAHGETSAMVSESDLLNVPIRRVLSFDDVPEAYKK